MVLKVISFFIGKLIYLLRGWTFEPLPPYWKEKQVLIGFPHTKAMDTVMAFAKSPEQTSQQTFRFGQLFQCFEFFFICLSFSAMRLSVVTKPWTVSCVYNPNFFLELNSL